MVDGSFLGDYTRIYDYCHELLRANPGSTVKLNVEPVQEGVEDQRPYFKRMYVCFAACKESFKLSRHILGLDGCFLKGLCGGQILAAIGRDPNDQMLPVAFAVVEGENKDSWTWFLQLLIEDLGGQEDCLTYTFISDQQKGLLPAMDELLPGVEQRFCVRHLYNNFRKKFPGKMLKDAIWKAAKTTYVQAWEREMRAMRLINGEAYLHMLKTSPRFWSKSHFKVTNKCDTLLNNMSESFNSVILESRSKPLITMIEEIRTYFMERWATNRMRFQNLSDDAVLPNIRKQVEKTSTCTNNWIVRMSDEHIFEVKHVQDPNEMFTVNLKDSKCSCRRWELTGLPCVHALSCMKSRNFKFEDYIPEYYKKSRYIAVYKPVIYPVNGSNLWEKTQYPDVHPPKYRKMPGRPKKKRNLEQGEIDGSDRKLRRTGLIVKCSRCKKSGHNKATCKVTGPTQTTESTQQNSTQTTQQASQQVSTQPTQQQPTQASQPTQQQPTQASQPTHQQPTQASQPTQQQTTQPSQTSRSRQPAAQKAKKLGVRRAPTPWVPPGPTTRLGASRIGPTTRRTTPTKRNSSKKNV
ncbi:uncharacterized protein LOC131631679 [Vicia villosa]|nr:uncharacterized protein LOC131631679 [Vicia villosa]